MQLRTKSLVAMKRVLRRVSEKNGEYVPELFTILNIRQL